MEKAQSGKTNQPAAQNKQACPRCGSTNTVSNPKERGHHLYCNHCGYETFE